MTEKRKNVTAVPGRARPGKEKFEAQLAALETLREQPLELSIPPLRAALKHSNNYLVAKAADLVNQRRVTELMPDLVAAFDRFFDDAERSDPQCWAKNALSRALAVLELQDPEPFLRGMRHVQLEGSWGGRSDTAGALRGTCALALVQCRDLREPELLRYLLDLLVDPDKQARTDAVRAIAQVGSPAASLALRMRALMGGDDDAEVLGGCYAAVLAIEGAAALLWVSHFLAKEDDAAGEAALAIASLHTPEAFAVLNKCWEKNLDPWFDEVLLSAMALTRQNEATEFLLALVEADSKSSEQAMVALLRALPSDNVRLRLKALVAGHPRLDRVFARHVKQSD